MSLFCFQARHEQKQKDQMNKKHVIVAALVGVLAGVVFANRIRAIPVIGVRIPSL